MDDNHLDGSLLGRLLWNQHITVLFLCSNSLEGSLPPPPSNWVAESSTLNTLKLQSNQFNGDCSDVIASLGNLQFLNVSHNQLSGSLPENISPFLERAALGSNFISGTLPSAFLWNTHLVELYLSGNSIESLPDAPVNWLANASVITYLDLYGNFVGGTFR